MRFIKNLIYNIKLIIRWIPRLWNTYDWDYGYLLKLEKNKLEDMIQWYEKNDYGSLESGPEVYKQLLIAYNLLKIFLEEEEDWYEYNFRTGVCTFKKYVNTKNCKRFLPDIEVINWITIIELRKEKAWHVYSEFRKRYLPGWAD